MDILMAQGGVCPICKKIPSSGIFHTDHKHVKGFKKMKQEDKMKYVRGVLCMFCNRFYLAKAMTIPKALNIITYLEKFTEEQQ